MTMDEFNAKLATRFVVVEGLPSSRCQTGEAYDAIWSPNWVEAEDGSRWAPQLHSTEGDAIASLWSALDQYANSKAGTAYIRRAPSVEYDDERRGWLATIRLAISDKPTLAEAA